MKPERHEDHRDRDASNNAGGGGGGSGRIYIRAFQPPGLAGAVSPAAGIGAL